MQVHTKKRKSTSRTLPGYHERKIERAKVRAAEKRNKRKQLLMKARKPFIICGGAVLALVLLCLLFSLMTINKDRVMNNVYVENLNVSGLTYDETLASINATYLFEKSEITLTDGKTTYTINGNDIGLNALPEETAKKAFEYCKSGNVIANAFNAAKLIFTPHVILPSPEIDENLLDEKLNECGKIMVGERIQHYAEFGDEDYAIIHSGQTGYNGDPTKVREQVLDALKREKFSNIRVNFTAAPPDDLTADSLDALIYKDPVDATYEIDGKKINIIPGEPGRYINKDEVKPYLSKVYEGCNPVNVPFYRSQPEITTDKLKAMLFADTLSSYSTSYAGSTDNRSANVARAATLVNGTIVAPGDVFSFNETVGHRTKENGFYTAKEYINGESVDGIGGGTCQVSSTLYSAALYADMDIVERLNHMMSVGYIPLGQDATVTDGGIDFRFENTSKYPIKIAAFTNGSTITVNILGTAWDPPKNIKITNNTSTVGDNTVVHSTRTVYSNGELVSTDTLNSSTYMPHKAAVSSNYDYDSDDDYDYGYDYDYDSDYDNDYDSDYNSDEDYDYEDSE